MKRYLLFAGDKMYPAGGWNDFIGSYDTQAEAVKMIEENTIGLYEWHHIIDTTISNEEFRSF